VFKVAEFLARVKNNRRQQLYQSDKEVELIYYSWFDEQAGQFRFNFINSHHQNLPFGCSLVFVSDEKEIIENFLSSFREIYLPWSELKDVDEDECEDENNSEYKLTVYKKIISR
jgi:hypothetical protein